MCLCLIRDFNPQIKWLRTSQIYKYVWNIEISETTNSENSDSKKHVSSIGEHVWWPWSLIWPWLSLPLGMISHIGMAHQVMPLRCMAIWYLFCSVPNSLYPPELRTKLEWIKSLLAILSYSIQTVVSPSCSYPHHIHWWYPEIWVALHQYITTQINYL